MFIIKNVKAHDLTAAEDANDNGINDALELDTDGDGILNFFDPEQRRRRRRRRLTAARRPSFTGNTLTVLANTFDEGGQGVAYNDNAGLDGGNTAFRPGPRRSSSWAPATTSATSSRASGWNTRSTCPRPAPTT